jgi:multimeric flavodoxin WrbA
MKKAIIIFGSSNSKGETYKMVEFVNNKTNFPIINLKTKNIGEFDYEFKNSKDDFLPLMEEIVTNYKLIIFATPVYWYNMSGILKTFFDRFSDCLKTRKDLGRKLKNMEMAVISCGYDKELKTGFHMPFKESANYLGMNYITDIHGWVRNDELSLEVKEKLNNFIKEIQ